MWSTAASRSGHLRLLEAVGELRRTPAQGVVAPELVDRPALGHRHQPGARVRGDALVRPLLEGRDQGVLREVLREVEVAGHPRQGGHQTHRLVPPDGGDRLVRRAVGHEAA